MKYAEIHHPKLDSAVTCNFYTSCPLQRCLPGVSLVVSLWIPNSSVISTKLAKAQARPKQTRSRTNLNRVSFACDETCQVIRSFWVYHDYHDILKYHLVQYSISSESGTTRYRVQQQPDSRYMCSCDLLNWFMRTSICRGKTSSILPAKGGDSFELCFTARC